MRLDSFVRVLIACVLALSLPAQLESQATSGEKKAGIDVGGG